MRRAIHSHDNDGGQPPWTVARRQSPASIRDRLGPLSLGRQREPAIQVQPEQLTQGGDLALGFGS